MSDGQFDVTRQMDSISDFSKSIYIKDYNFLPSIKFIFTKENHNLDIWVKGGDDNDGERIIDYEKVSEYIGIHLLLTSRNEI
jgi:hypothetical protein